MKKFIYLSLISLITSGLYAQYAGQPNVTNSYANGNVQALVNQASGGIKGQNERLAEMTGIDEFSGSPYATNEFKPTAIYYEAEKVGEVYYRYNAHNEEIEIKQTLLPEEEFSALSKDKSVYIIADTYKLSFKTFTDKSNNTLNGYLYTLLEGEKYDLFKRINVKFTPGQKAENTFVKAKPNRFSQFTEYYIQEKGVNRIDEIPLRNKKFTRMLSKKDREKVDTYLKNQDLNIKNEEDLIQAIEMLNNQ
ncbi:hypothetical protein [Leeuwenhoekiella nanhaiensis]|nr:hypothetical protein [Leeuwenhoekiella nanhaiensis]